MADSLRQSMEHLDILKDEYARRSGRNPRYSVRAFAADLGVSPAYLSMIFRGQRRLNEVRARDIASRTGWSEEKQKLFNTMVRFECSPGGVTADATRKELDLLLDRNENYDRMKIDTFRMIAKWYHAALIELTGLPDFQDSPAWIARRLGVSPIEAELALDRLVRLGFLARDEQGDVIRQAGKIEVEEIPSKAIREFHKGILSRAMSSLDDQTVEERDFASLTLAIDKDKLPEAKKRLKQFLKDMSSLLHTGRRNALYQLSYQFFRVDRPAEGVPEC